ncbi:radical SAM protein [Azotobacter chroococcum]|uniref:radical SAM protein n=1 Tax=Azotobacter chroococcum TaxID=353 RepID=UPI001F6199DC|nr:radical SAM protein [Azotobacter chroococcum]
MHATLPLLNALGFPAIRRGRLEALQVNLTYRCNQRCLHCHVNAGPTRSEAMTDESLALLHQVIDAHPVQTLDLTGGAPEMHPRFREIVTHARREGLRVIDRCNLTILGEPSYADLAAFLAEQGVEVTASLPCLLARECRQARFELWRRIGQPLRSNLPWTSASRPCWPLSCCWWRASS